MIKILIWRVKKVALFTLILENWESHSQFQSHFFLSELSLSTLNFYPRTLILKYFSKIFSLEVSFSISTLSKLTLTEVCTIGPSLFQFWLNLTNLDHYQTTLHVLVIFWMVGLTVIARQFGRRLILLHKTFLLRMFQIKLCW